MADILRDMLVSYEAENCAVKTVALVTASVLLIPVIFPVTVTITAVALAGVAFVMDICASLEALRAKMEELRRYVQQCMEMLQQYWNHAGDLIQHVVSGRPIIKTQTFLWIQEVCMLALPGCTICSNPCSMRWTDLVRSGGRCPCRVSQQVR